MNYNFTYKRNNSELIFNTDFKIKEVKSNGVTLKKKKNNVYSLGDLECGLNILKASVFIDKQLRQFDIIVPYGEKKEIEFKVMQETYNIDLSKYKKFGKNIAIWVVQENNYLYNKVLIKKMIGHEASVGVFLQEDLILKAIIY